MAVLVALINKETLKVICETKKVTPSYIADKISCKPAAKVDEWLTPTSKVLPTFNQAKKIANCLHIPFAGLYMNPDDVPKKQLPQIVNRRILFDEHSHDESSLNIAISDLLEAKDLLLSFKQELNESQIPFNANIDTNASADIVALNIRKHFDIN